ncbi:MAG: hypothetical protein EA341_01005 [Mongoliibacter sp.]|nr:MAG: hypothetical protein EA341_01005 [Mongoliibacter sp.]
MIIFLIIRKNQQAKSYFHEENINRLKLEKKEMEKELTDKDSTIEHLEKDLIETRKSQLELSEKNGSLTDENEALRKLLSELKIKKEEKSEDVIVEYIFKQDDQK